MLKRVFDVGVSVFMLIPRFRSCSSGLHLYETGRPILYRQKRVGESGRIFEILKFRSMRVEAEQDAFPGGAKERRSRHARRQILRVTRIDELPQLINVLRAT